MSSSTGRRPGTSTPPSSMRSSTRSAGSCATSTPATTRHISCEPDGDLPPTPRRSRSSHCRSEARWSACSRRWSTKKRPWSCAPGMFSSPSPTASHNPGSEEVGKERLQRLLHQTAHLPANEIGARLSDEMKDWIRDAEQYDDLTFIVMKV